MNITRLNTLNDDKVIVKQGGGTGGDVVINNQNKSVEITENGRTSVVHDDGYTGLGKVDVNVNVPPKNQDKTVDIVENGTLEVVADSGFTGLGTVSVNVNVPSSGGGTTPASANDVTFYDYDGTVLHSYSKDAFLALSEFPALPTREGLICQEWNWSYEDAKNYVQENGKLDIGATYITDDGKTRFYIKVEEGRKEIPFKFSINKTNSLVIDWGDGVTESISESGSQDVSHTYDKVGDYVISFDVAEGANLTFSFSISSSYGVIVAPYSAMLRKLEVGHRISIGSFAFWNCSSLSSVVIPNSVTNIGDYVFEKCYSLLSIVIPNGVTSIGKYAFDDCASLSSVVIPNSVTNIGNYVFQNCYSLLSVVISNSVTSVVSNAFCNCYSLLSIVIPNGVTSIGSSAFEKCYSLSSVVIPNSVTNIEDGAFRNCSKVAFYDFRTHTAVPKLSSTGGFAVMASDCKLVVPDTLYSSWITATNWSTYASKIVKASEFNG